MNYTKYFATALLAITVVTGAAPDAVSAAPSSKEVLKQIAELIDSVGAEELPKEEVQSFPETRPREARYRVRVGATMYSSDPRQTDASPCQPAMSRFNMCEEFKKTGIGDTIAANFLPLGTRVRFPELYGDEIFVVRDRMNAKYNGQNRIDIWSPSSTSSGKEAVAAKQKAIQFGYQRGVLMEVL